MVGLHQCNLVRSDSAASVTASSSKSNANESSKGDGESSGGYLYIRF